MPKYVIERELPGAGDLSAGDLQAISQKSVEVLADMAPRAQWLQSYVADDRLFCVYIADDPEAVREHARCGGFPVTNVYRPSSTRRPPRSRREAARGGGGRRPRLVGRRRGMTRRPGRRRADLLDHARHRRARPAHRRRLRHRSRRRPRVAASRWPGR